MVRNTMRLWFAVLIAFLSFGPIHAANSSPKKPVAKEEVLPVEVQQMVDRVYEIKAMDFSTLTVTEKKELKQELKGIKHDLKAVTGVYFSIGALIIIILLLILIL